VRVELFVLERCLRRVVVDVVDGDVECRIKVQSTGCILGFIFSQHDRTYTAFLLSHSTSHLNFPSEPTMMQEHSPEIYFETTKLSLPQPRSDSPQLLLRRMNQG